jgi:RNA polymerase sigma factor (sigma-70 family)
MAVVQQNEWCCVLYFKTNRVNLTATVYHDELVAKCKQGDRYSFELLYHQYAKAMYNTSLRIVNNSADAEDVLQEAFVSAFQLDKFDYTSTFGAWLKRIVINKSIDVLRRRNRLVVEMNENNFTSVADTEPIDEDQVQLKAYEIINAMVGLPSGYRTVLSLYLFEGYDYEEISDILKISTTTVRTQYHRGKQKLLQLLQKGGTP